MYDTIVAIDLETTGIDPYSDHIIEVGAALYTEGQIVDRFDELIKSPVALRPEIVQLTGITQEMLDKARPRAEVLADFMAFVPEDAICIAHNSAFDRTFLRNATRDAFGQTVLDTVGLSRICFPELESHSLEFLKSVFGIRAGTAHRALADCETLLALWEKILEKLFEIPLPVVGEINYLLASVNHPYREFFRWLEAEKLTREFGENHGKFEDVFKAYAPAARPFDFVDDEEAEEKPLAEERVTEIFGASGELAANLQNFEFRQGQLDMAQAVTAAYNSGRHLLIEAGTGIGKSLAYLVPSVLHAVENGSPVVISTNTKNLQSQLFDKDIPLVRQALGLDFKAAVIKGRRNYLCLRKLVYVLRQAAQELDREERMRMLNLLPWAAWSDTGDVSENIVSGRPGFGALWGKLSTIGDECMGKGCRFFKKCFLQKARARALSADIVVANHSLVFAEMNMKSPALPPYRRIVFDEAHNLEEAATRHLSIEVSQSRLRFSLGRMFRPGKKGGDTGLLPSILSQLEGKGCSASTELREQAREFAASACSGVDKAEAPLLAFFDSLESVLAARKDEDCVRYDQERMREEQWGPVREAKTAMGAALAAPMHSCLALRDCLKEMEQDQLQYRADFIRDLEAAVQWLREITEDVEFALEAKDESYVFWLERTPGQQGGPCAWAAPKEIGPLLFDQVYQRKKSVVFCSATMSVRGDFSFVKKRLGIDLVDPERITELDAGTPFDYERQCLVLAPLFLPEPGERGTNYARELAALLAEVFRRTRGRALTLFTSHKMLREVAADLQQSMLGDGINILSQGLSGSRESITAAFKRDIHSVLLGTHSFWEGVDVVGEALSCLVIARLPFQVFTDPVVEARCERLEQAGDNAFLGYSVPSAVIKFKQGFGRLIRHKTDRGIAIVTDRRMITKRYGKWFQDSLPCRTAVFSSREEFLDAVSGFLG